MITRLRDNELKIVADIVRDRVFVPTSSWKTTVFLCGADISDTTTGRYKISKLLKENSRYELLYPEDLFDDLMAGQGQYSLLDLENLLAKSVDAIVLLPESPGSFAELGAFANNTGLVEKLICIGQERYSKKKSFINYGPLRLIRRSKTGKVINIQYQDLTDTIEREKIYRRIREVLTQIKLRNPIKKDVGNIMETENFVLPCIYLIDLVTTKELIKLVEYATNKDIKICEIATKSSLSRLLRKTFIKRTTVGYAVTKQGIDQVRASAYRKTNIDAVRMEIINSQNRKHAMINSANI